MNKHFIWITIAIIAVTLVLNPRAALAHTGLKSSSPEASEVVAKEIEKILLTFGTNIESISSLELINETGEKLNVKVETGKDFMTGTLEHTLENGTYTVEWRVVGADSHVVKGSYSFIVKLPDPSSVQLKDEVKPEASASTKTQVPSNEIAGTTATETETVNLETPESVDTSNTIQPTNSINSKTIIGVAAIALCLALAAYGIWRLRKN